jgi:plasmid stability protein
MAQLIVRKIEDEVLARLRERAASPRYSSRLETSGFSETKMSPQKTPTCTGKRL